MRKPAYGVLALFPSADALLKAIPKVKARGYAQLEAYTPYPVHGLDAALGLPESKLGVLVFLMAAFGAVGVFAFEWWANAVNYPLLTGGKNAFTWPAWIPPTLEGSIFLGTFTAALAMLFIFNGLPFFGHPLLQTKTIDEITRDRFALLIVPSGAAFDEADAAAALRAAGGAAVETLPAPSHETPDAAWWTRTALAIAAACAVAGGATAFAIRVFPTVKPMVNMEVQPRLDAQEPDSFFANGRGMRLPPAGTVPRGGTPILAASLDAAGRELIDPLPVTEFVLERGRRQFDRHCAVCHDRLGTGRASLSSVYTAKPADLQSSTMRKIADGSLYWVISQGYNTMPAYAADVSPDDRWAIVRYIRALQRSQDAPERDLK